MVSRVLVIGEAGKVGVFADQTNARLGWNDRLGGHSYRKIDF